MIKKLNDLNLFLIQNSLRSEADAVIALKKYATPTMKPIGNAPARLTLDELFKELNLDQLGLDETTSSIESGGGADTERIRKYSEIIEKISSYPGGKEGYEITVFDEWISKLTSSEEELEGEVVALGPDVPRSSQKEAIEALRQGDLFEDNNDDGLFFDDIENNPHIINLKEKFRDELRNMTDSDGNKFTENDLDILFGEADAIFKEAGLWDDIKGGVSSAAEYAGKATKSVGKGTWKMLSTGGRLLMDSLPFVGLIWTFTALIKNFIEATKNCKKIIHELPLSKYGLSKSIAINPMGARDAIIGAIDRNREDPDSIMELLKIANIVERYYVDFLKVATNSFLLIIDVASIMALTGWTIPFFGWAAALGAGAVAIGLTFGLVGLELGGEYFSDKHWEEAYSHTLNICQEEIAEAQSSAAAEPLARESAA